MMIATPTRSRAVTLSPRISAAVATPKNGLRKWKVAARVAPIRRDQHEPDHRRGEPRHQHGVEEGQRQRQVQSTCHVLEDQRDRQAARRCPPASAAPPPSRGRPPPDAPRTSSVATLSASTPGDAERERRADRRPAPSRAVMITSTPAKPAASPASASGASRSPRTTRPSAGDDQRQQARDDHRDARLDRAHRHEVQPEIERVLAQPEDHHRRPLRRAARHALAERPADAERDQPRDQEADRQRQERRRIGDDDARRGEGRAPHRDESDPEPQRPPIHRPPPETKQAAPAGAARSPRPDRRRDQALITSLSCLAIVTLATRSAGFFICSPVEGLRTCARAGRGRRTCRGPAG